MCCYGKEKIKSERKDEGNRPIYMQESDRGEQTHWPGGRFLKVPKLYGPFSGVTIPFVTVERRAFNSSNFTVIFLFVTLKIC